MQWEKPALTRPSLQDVTRAAGGPAAAAPGGSARCRRGEPSASPASNRGGRRPRSVAPAPDWPGSPRRPAAYAAASAAAASAGTPPSHKTVAGEPATAAGTPARRPRTAATPWLHLRAQNRHEACEEPSADHNIPDGHRAKAEGLQSAGQLRRADSRVNAVSADTRIPCACLDSGCSWNGSVANLAILGMPVVRRWAPT